MSFETRLADKYDGLSGALQQAARYLEDNPIDVATRPLRSVSKDSGVSPAAFTRLVRALDYADFEQLRDEFRIKIERKVNNFADRAGRLQRDHQSNPISFFDAHLAACQANLESVAQVDRALLEQAVSKLSEARKVVLMGALGSTGVVEYLSYMANFCADNWAMASRMGASLGGGLTGLDNHDALIIVTKPPFADRAIKAARLAQDRGVYVIVITDTNTCPALSAASAGFVLPTASPHFYSSYVTTLFFVEALIGLIVSRSGDAAKARIAEVENTTRLLAEVWDQ
jgi:DNA-binding MurR/RpiR family transcriptional regulator